MPTPAASPSEPGPVVGPGLGRPRGASPFADVVPTLWFAAGYAVAIGLWLAVGDRLPGGRWLAVHLFTLGVLTNVILAFSEHFTRAVTRTPGVRPPGWVWVTNLGVLLVLAGLPRGWVPGLAAGTTILLVTVATAWWRLGRMRRRAVGARLGWVGRRYEDAHVAFLAAVVAGTVLGLGLVPSGWVTGVRLAHLHGNVLGWGGITLLATLVFFGPTMARCQIEPGADRSAAHALRAGVPALLAAVVAFVLLGLPGPATTAARLAAAAGLAGFALAASVVLLPVWRAVRRARVTAARPLVLGVVAWFLAVVWADVVVVATGAWPWLDVLGLVALSGVLASAILATVVYLAPMLRGRTTGERELVRIRLEVGARSRSVALNLGVAAVAVGTMLTGPVGSATGTSASWPVAGAGWMLVGLCVVVTVATGLWPLGPGPQAADG